MNGWCATGMVGAVMMAVAAGAVLPAEASTYTFLRNNGLIEPSPVPARLSQKPGTLDLYACTDDILGVRLLCNPDWGLETDRDAILMIISSDPAVTLTVVKIESGIKFLEQLSTMNFERMDQYQEGFRTERSRVGSYPAIKVKAFSKEYPEIRLLDYYIVHNNTLYGVLFSVNPKDKWDDYKFLFQKVVDSFEFHSFQDSRSATLSPPAER